MAAAHRFLKRERHLSWVRLFLDWYRIWVCQLNTNGFSAGNRWHIDCFRCSTCGTLLDSDAHLLLLGDGALICSNCTYSCSSCGNKIEDLAILTGEQAFCKRCFRCRNCKKEIDNLRYARTSQGIFCMDCHESLMQRRRKRNRVAAAANKKQPGVKLDKSLPSLPPEEETHSRPADDPAADAYADATTEVASHGAAPALDSAKFDDSTPRQSPNDGEPPHLSLLSYCLN